MEKNIHYLSAIYICHKKYFCTRKKEIHNSPSSIHILYFICSFNITKFIKCIYNIFKIMYDKIYISQHKYENTILAQQYFKATIFFRIIIANELYPFCNVFRRKIHHLACE